MEKVVCVSAIGGDVYFKLDGDVKKISALHYSSNISQLRPCVIFSDSHFPYESDVVFESLLDNNFRLEYMWCRDLLAKWWHIRMHTGIDSVYGRLDALELAAYKFGIGNTTVHQ